MNLSARAFAGALFLSTILAGAASAARPGIADRAASPDETDEAAPLVQTMFYRPRSMNTGAMWDTWLYLHEGTYYLSYLAKPGGNWDNISVASSPDGVHWTEIGRVLSEGPGVTWMGTGSTWKSPRFDRDWKYFMNFSEWRGPRRTIFFAESSDLLHWTWLGNQPEFVQDERWYERNGRWDGIWTIPKPDGHGLYGYWTATKLAAWMAAEVKQRREPGKAARDAGLPKAVADYRKVVPGTDITLEIVAAFDRAASTGVRFGLKLRVSADGNRAVRVWYDPRTDQYGMDGEVTKKAAAWVGVTRDGSANQAVTLRIFLDRSILEVYSGGAALTARTFSDPTALGVDLFAEGGPARLESFDVSEMRSMWASDDVHGNAAATGAGRPRPSGNGRAIRPWRNAPRSEMGHFAASPTTTRRPAE